MKKSITPSSEVPSPFDPGHQRYSGLPFPSHRFIPGLTLHPHTISPLPTLKKGGGGDFLYGIDLFNFNYWWEAHEAWEMVWKTTAKTDDDGKFLQGLIQISAGMIKWWTGNLSGMKKLFKEGLEKLRSIPEQNLMGLDLKNQIARIQHFEESPSAENYPYIGLQPDPRWPKSKVLGRKISASISNDSTNLGPDRLKY